MDKNGDRVNVDLDIPADKKVIVTWDRKIGLESKVKVGNWLGTYDEVGNPEATKKKIKAPISGKIIFLEPPGHEISPLRICVMEKCKHDVQIGGLCTFCGAKVVESQNESVGYVHKVFKLSHEKAKEVYEELELEVLDSKKLFLVLDLDNTLIHAEMSRRVELDFKPEEEGLRVLNFYSEQFIVKLRPFLQEFLADLSLKYLIHVYTKGTREYAEEILRQVDPYGIYVSNERLISRNEMGENEYKSIKKVIHDGSLALILDDRSDVWGNIKNLVYTQPFHYFENVEGKLKITRRLDVFLYMIKGVLEMIHEIFYLFNDRNERLKVYEIYHMIRQNLFSKERVAFFGLFHNEEELKKSREYKSLRKLGTDTISFEPTKETTLIFSRHSGKIKNYPITEVPIVSLWYIYYCEMYCTHLNPQDFDLRMPNEALINLEKSIHKTPEEKNAAKDMVEDLLLKNESNKGGIEYIKDLVIRKLEIRNETKEARREEYDDSMEEITKKVKTDTILPTNEHDFNLSELNHEGQDNQEIIDREVSFVHNYLGE